MKLSQEYREAEVIQKSRFLACVTRTETEEEARAYIARIRNEFPDATHVCTAYVIGPSNQIQRSSDNKEPSGTAGIPILESLLKSGLTDTTVCVVRYFGGIKLGTGGLIRAYGGISASALAHAPKVKEVPVNLYRVVYPYSLSGTLESWLRTNTIQPDFSYAEEVTCTFASMQDDIPEQIRDRSRGTVQAEFLGTDTQETSV